MNFNKLVFRKFTFSLRCFETLQKCRYLDNMALSGLVEIPLSSTVCPVCTPKKPFFLLVGSFLLSMLDMEKFVEPPLLFCEVVPLPKSFASFSSSFVLITGKHVILGEATCFSSRKLSGSGLPVLLVDSGLDTTFTSMSRMSEEGELIFSISTERSTNSTSFVSVFRHWTLPEIATRRSSKWFSAWSTNHKQFFFGSPATVCTAMINWLWQLFTVSELWEGVKMKDTPLLNRNTPSYLLR